MKVVLASMISLFLSAAILLIGHGLQYTLIPLYAVSLHWQPEIIGYIGSSYFSGFVIGCLTIPALVSRVGHIRVFASLIALMAASMLFIAISQQFIYWLIARGLMGWAMAGTYMVIESWLNEKTPTEHRGSVLSVYAVITLAAICVGQLLVGLSLPYVEMFMVAAIIMLAGVLPIGLTTRTVPSPIPDMRFSFKRILGVSQIAMVGAFISGIITGGFWALGPVVASTNQMNPSQIGIFMAVTLIGGAVLQFPVGRASDYIDRRRVIGTVALVGVVICLAAMQPFIKHPTFMFVTMFVFGGLVFPIYALCLAHANDNTDLSVIEIGSGILMMNSLGSVIGPLIISPLISVTEQGLFIISALAFFILAVWTLYRVKFHKVDREHFEPFVSVNKTTHEVIELGMEQDELSPIDEELPIDRERPTLE